jgi:hypothetical protein
MCSLKGRRPPRKNSSSMRFCQHIGNRQDDEKIPINDDEEVRGPFQSMLTMRLSWN